MDCKFTRYRKFTKPVIYMAGMSIILFFVLINIPLSRDDFRRDDVQSVRFFDRRGILLRECLNNGEIYAQRTSLEDISPYAPQAAIATEDKRFYLHPGVDPFAIFRAIFDNFRTLSLKSGGSTLTQQVIRNTYHHPRTVLNKIKELYYALRLERMMTKQEILEQYLNRIPFGNLIVGIEAASRSYFGKPSKELSLAQAAFLMSLPNSPTFLNPRKDIRRALTRQRLVLRRMLDEGFVTKDEYDRAINEPLQLSPVESTIRAAHATDMMLARLQDRRDISEFNLTIDYNLQEQVQGIVKSRIASFSKRNVTNCAVVIIDNASGEIKSLIGSVDYFDEKLSGSVNGALALRQPGSAIKTLMYTLAFEQGFSPADVIPDIPTAIPDHAGEYFPENYDRKSHGPVRIRTALACSYNVPAVRVLRSIGKDLFLNRLHSVGFTTLNESPDFYGYGITLGNGEVTLIELTNAYAAIANGGIWKPIHIVSSVEYSNGTRGRSPFDAMPSTIPKRVYEGRASFLVTDILRDPVARRPAFGNNFRFPFQCAVKTGTTKDYRDNWTIGYTTMYTVGVWVGNFNGSPMHGVSGVTGAGQIFSDIINVLHLSHSSTFPRDFSVPNGLEKRKICTLSGKMPGKYCPATMEEWFIPSKESGSICTIHQAYRVREDDGKISTRVYTVLPGEYSEWCQSQTIQIPPPTAKLIGNCEVSEENNRKSLSIIQPIDGDCFKIDPILRNEYQKIRVIASVPDNYPDAQLIVDDISHFPYDKPGVWWTLERGKHILRVEARQGKYKIKSEPVLIVVE